jgi:hypothetical protein
MVLVGSGIPDGLQTISQVLKVQPEWLMIAHGRLKLAGVAHLALLLPVQQVWHC